MNLISTVEYQNFGLNLFTISAFATIFFSLVKGYGITQQGVKIWRKKSGKNLSPIFFFYNFFYFLIFLFYGIEEKSLAITSNGLLSFFYLPVLFGLKKYRGFSKKELVLVIIMSLVIPLSFLFNKNQIIFIFSIVAIVAFFSQFREIWLTKDFGALSVSYLKTFLVATIFWGIYYFFTKNYLLSILNDVELIIIGLALILEKKWRKKNDC